MPKRATLEGKGLDVLMPHLRVARGPAGGKTAKLVRKTFLLTPDLVERLDKAIEREGVGKNEFVRYALDTFCKELESEQRRLPVETKEVRTIVTVH